jgi:catechol 2,3-dioxygenase-like lactoylglutathione lyase family enzyme
MKRMHIHVGVENLDRSINFYSTLFGAAPVKTQTDYAKWMPDDLHINFAISTRAGKQGVDHLGLQVDDDSELEELRERLKSADLSVFDEGETVCCYARSDKTWARDPSGIAWEAYKTMEDAQLFSDSETSESEACCTPETRGQAECCVPSAQTAGCCG